MVNFVVRAKRFARKVRHATCRAGRVSLEAAPIVPFGGDAIAGVGGRVMDEIQQGTDAKHKARNLYASAIVFCDCVEQCSADFGNDHEVSEIVQILAGVTQSMSDLQSVGQIRRWVKLQQCKDVVEDNTSLLHRQEIRFEIKYLHAIYSSVNDIQQQVGLVRADQDRQGRQLNSMRDDITDLQSTSPSEDDLKSGANRASNKPFVVTVPECLLFTICIVLSLTLALKSFPSVQRSVL